MEISVIGLSHRTAPLRVREQCSLPPDQAIQMLHAIRREDLCKEALVLDTCNRTELYSVGGAVSVAHILRHLAAVKQRASTPGPSPFYHHRNADAVNHLFRVAASLDSQMVGEHEIIGQVKSAYRLALEAHSAQFIMNRLMHRAFRVAKRVQAETRLGQGATSLSECAVDVARRTLSGLNGKTALLIGAGEAAMLASQALVRSGVTRLIVANRSIAHAQRLAEQFAAAPGEPIPAPEAARQAPSRCSLKAEAREAAGDSRRSVRVVPLDRLASVLSRADLIISSVGAPAGILTRAHFGATRRRPQRPLLIMDLAVPRDVAPDVAGLPNVTLLNLDDLGRAVAENLQRRREEIPRAEAIVREEAQWFGRWLESLDAVGVIKLLRLRAVEIQQAELSRYQGKFAPADRERLEMFAQGLCSKLLRDPIAFLRSEGAADAGDGTGLANMDLVRRMFRLESEESER